MLKAHPFALIALIPCTLSPQESVQLDFSHMGAKRCISSSASSQTSTSTRGDRAQEVPTGMALSFSGMSHCSDGAAPSALPENPVADASAGNQAKCKAEETKCGCVIR